MRNKYLYITLLSILGLNAEAQEQLIAQAPRLVISITIDQLRTDYLETYVPLYGNEGLKKLLTEGKVFTNGAYHFTPVDRASAIASLHTGTVPYYNGITAEEWLDKQTLRPQNCVRDQKIGYSPQFLGTSTISDELKMATNGIAKVFSFAPTADAAILSAGHAADGAAWISNGQWVTTTYYRPVNQWLSGYTRLFQPGADTNKSLDKENLRSPLYLITSELPHSCVPSPTATSFSSELQPGPPPNLHAPSHAHTHTHTHRLLPCTPQTLPTQQTWEPSFSPSS